MCNTRYVIGNTAHAQPGRDGPQLHCGPVCLATSCIEGVVDHASRIQHKNQASLSLQSYMAQCVGWHHQLDHPLQHTEGEEPAGE